MSETTCKIMLNSLVTSKLDYCNAGLAGTINTLVTKNAGCAEYVPVGL